MTPSKTVQMQQQYLTTTASTLNNKRVGAAYSPGKYVFDRERLSILKINALDLFAKKYQSVTRHSFI
jgi:hypothetical protein